MSRYSEWYLEQSKEFREEVSNGEITEIFKDRNIRAISLEELEELDEKFC